MPDWRDTSPNYITYAQSQNKPEAQHAYLSLDAVVNLEYEAGEFGRSINETPPRSRFDKPRVAKKAERSSVLEDRRDGDEEEEFAHANSSTNELSEYLADDSFDVAGGDGAAEAGETGAGEEEASSLYEGAVKETVVEGSDVVDEEASMIVEGEIKKRKRKGGCAGGDAVGQALVRDCYEDHVVECEDGSSERVNRIERKRDSDRG